MRWYDSIPRFTKGFFDNPTPNSRSPPSFSPPIHIHTHNHTFQTRSGNVK